MKTWAGVMGVWLIALALFVCAFLLYESYLLDVDFAMNMSCYFSGEEEESPAVNF